VPDALTLSGRCLRLSRRNMEALLTSLMLPVMLMLLFVYLFGGAIETGVRSLDVGGPAVLAGHATASVVRNAASTVPVLAVGVLIGLRPHADLLDWAGPPACWPCSCSRCRGSRR
jgi:ABC-2 type transport system permease protein